MNKVQKKILQVRKRVLEGYVRRLERAAGLALPLYLASPFVQDLMEQRRGVRKHSS